ncbi:MAG: TetR/AcrR family transcriptional regulator [Gammaproteobacteria bacterium]|nr:TetR/AcrR family transcriptional regulator [Gammaproteobacteria bacterium]MBT8050453.1 TetR/AcrR family transcriptional regulator [Gammaproteobacteria bacterium]NNJ79617.1 TetR/AcrR family transcriptional regulator [Xanthomonadales bacterium]
MNKSTKQEPAAEQRARGRPRSEEKHRKIMQAAMELFTQNGFEGTSVDLIAEAAGVSKQTVYSHFGCKETLFGLAISSKCKMSGIEPEAIDADAPPERVLPEIAVRFLDLINSPEALGVHAICTGSAESHPELGLVYFERGPLATVHAVSHYLEAQVRAGHLQIDDPESAAWQFLCMIKAESHMRVQFNLEPMDKGMEDKYVASCVAMFLRAYMPGHLEP